MNRFLQVLVLVLLCTLAWSTQAQEDAVTLRSTVSGNRELPRVMYIVPWRQPVENETSWQPQESIANELFEPVRRDEFTRQLKYRDMIEVAAQGGVDKPENIE